MAGIQSPTKNMERIFEEALEIAREKKDPKRKRERRLKERTLECKSIPSSGQGRGEDGNQGLAHARSCPLERF